MTQRTSTVLSPSTIKAFLEFKRIPDDVCAALEKAFTWAVANQNSNNPAPGITVGYLREIDRAGNFTDDYVHGVKFNILYALSNMNGWRGPEAQEAKKILKAYTKGV